MWETVATFDNPLVAEMAKNMLTSRGIEAMLEDGETVAVAWQLSNALGGIKLRVRREDADQARDALDGFGAGEKVADDAIASRPDLARQLAAADVPEPFDDTPTDRAVDRAFKIAVLGLMFPPAQLIVFWFLAGLWGASPPVRPRDRWKIATALAINIPLWFILWFVVAVPLLRLNNSMHDPDGPHWQSQRFTGFGDHAVTLDLPNPHGFDTGDELTVLGQAKLRTFGAQVGPETYGVFIRSLDKIRDPRSALADVVAYDYRDPQLKEKSITPTVIDGHPATEVQAVYTDPKTRQRRFIREKVIAFPPHLVHVRSDVPEARKESAITKRFFASLRTE